MQSRVPFLFPSEIILVVIGTADDEIAVICRVNAFAQAYTALSRDITNSNLHTQRFLCLACIDNYIPRINQTQKYNTAKLKQSCAIVRVHRGERRLFVNNPQVIQSRPSKTYRKAYFSCCFGKLIQRVVPASKLNLQ